MPRYGTAPQPDDSPMLVRRSEVERIVAALGRQRGTEVPAGLARDVRCSPNSIARRARAVLVHRDGRLVPVVLALAAFKDEAGQPGGLIAVATDLTERKRLEEALRDSEARAHEANLAKSAFLAAMSHEIRTPMIGVTGMVEILAHTPLDADQRRALNVIQSSADSLLQIIGDILDFSKIEAGRLELSSSPVDLRTRGAHDGREFHRLGVEQGPGVVVLQSTIASAPAYRADGLRVRQILANFLSNAIKFTDHGRVEAALEWRESAAPDAGALGGDRLRIRVTDTGIGVSAEQQARLFQPFSQADADTTRRFGGTGLGLAISPAPRRTHGRVGHDGQRAGEGHDDAVRLRDAPCAAEASKCPPNRCSPPPPALAPRKLPTPAEAEAERSLILLVDDHPTNRAVIARQLALAGYASETAGRRRARPGALAFAAATRWCSATCTCRSSTATSSRARSAKKKRANSRARTPIVALTASAMKGEAERCIAAGMDDYLAKPVGIPALATMLGRWLPHTQAEPAPAVDLAAMLPQAERPPPIDAQAARRPALTGGDAVETRALLDDFLASTARRPCDAAGRARGRGSCRRDPRGAQDQGRRAQHRGGRAGRKPPRRWRPPAARRTAAAVPALAADVATAVHRLALWTEARWPRAV